jgi:hypothetical protein
MMLFYYLGSGKCSAVPGKYVLKGVYRSILGTLCTRVWFVTAVSLVSIDSWVVIPLQPHSFDDHVWIGFLHFINGRFVSPGP